ncbi:xaa-pro aminopeptidase [Pseudohyphozyma bogoriensis]|nr:xaa-pro aminopeptidase [Pseudohyphozyma bogoriensis]
MSCLSVFLPSKAPSPTPERAPLLSKERCSDDKRARTARVQGQSTTARLADLRGAMKSEGVDVYVVPTADAHNSESVGECDKRRVWISGFTGSAGVAVVSADKAHLFTDSRYFVQAAKELDSNWTLMKTGLKDVPNWDEFLVQLPKETTVAIDPTLITFAAAKALSTKLAAGGVTFKFLTENLVDKVWTDRPPRPSNPVKVHPLKFAGKEASEKIASLRSYLSSSSPSSPPPSYLLTSLNNIAWILNLRGSDIRYSPYFYGYLLVTPTGLTLWVQDEAVSSEVREVVEGLGGKIESYENVWKGFGGVKVLSSSTTSKALVDVIGEENFKAVVSPVDAAEGIKNDVELQGIRDAYTRDGAAWVKWAAWLEEQIKSGAQINEWDAGVKLTSYRETGEHYVGLAYDNISATGANAALPHYDPSETESSIIDPSTPYLNDSGPQYLDGTIDTTRTVHFGKPTKEQRRAFTRVLQGHIAVDTLIFPEGTTGQHIDVLARSPLWSDGMNYGHGTGHGVGAYLGIHEGPEGISGSVGSAIPLVPGHVLSNEPGFYEEGSFGIRIESVVGVKEVTTRRAFGDKRWLGFERFTTVPIQSSFVDYSLLSPAERKWLRKHNKLCVQKLAPLVAGDKRALKWLKRQ